MSFYLGRAYYNYVGLLERLLLEFGLDRHLCPGMGHILFCLYEQDNLAIREISERTQLAYSTLTGMLSRMERARIVRRSRDRSDKRVVRIRLTGLGRSLEFRCSQLVLRLNGILEKDLGPREKSRLKRMLAGMIENMRGEKDTAPGCRLVAQKRDSALAH
ncbi:MAG: MarR family winged helix-turn-helix transcriptional regulator [Planctomycetota bacterium]|nr:MarR family winged helix-turn-helix transcriptional regulator [Planctomycetota bacterium]